MDSRLAFNFAQFAMILKSLCHKNDTADRRESCTLLALLSSGKARKNIFILHKAAYTLNTLSQVFIVLFSFCEYLLSLWICLPALAHDDSARIRAQEKLHGPYSSHRSRFGYHCRNFRVCISEIAESIANYFVRSYPSLPSENLQLTIMAVANA
jgi:hypothetical protein